MPNISDQNALMPATKSFFDRQHQAGFDTLMAYANVDDECAKLRPESQIMGTHEAEDPRPVFPN